MNTDSRDEHFRTVSDSYGRWFVATKGPGLFPVDNSCCLGHVAWRAPCHLLPIKKECRVTKCTLDDCGNCEGRYRIVECCGEGTVHPRRSVQCCIETGNTKRNQDCREKERRPRRAMICCSPKSKPRETVDCCNEENKTRVCCSQKGGRREMLLNGDGERHERKTLAESGPRRAVVCCSQERKPMGTAECCVETRRSRGSESRGYSKKQDEGCCSVHMRTPKCSHSNFY
ncbi:hypothetical protein ACOME3_004267 [Neoechinorhynchus agilis]